MPGMNNYEASAEVRRWKLVAILAITLLVGFLAGQFVRPAHAQTGVTKVQLDTSNCSNDYTLAYRQIPADGALVLAARTTTEGSMEIFYSTCS